MNLDDEMWFGFDVLAGSGLPNLNPSIGET